jgi:hypothetical protein
MGPNPRLSRQLPPEQRDLALYCPTLHRLVEQHPEPARVDGLGEIVVGSFPHGRHRRLDGGVTGEEG